MLLYQIILFILIICHVQHVGHFKTTNPHDIVYFIASPWRLNIILFTIHVLFILFGLQELNLSLVNHRDHMKGKDCHSHCQ